MGNRCIRDQTEKEAGGNLHHEDAHLLLLALDLPDDAE
jgi:hypothetical protein